MKTVALEVYKLLYMLVIISSWYLYIRSPFTCAGVTSEWSSESRSRADVLSTILLTYNSGS